MLYREFKNYTIYLMLCIAITFNACKKEEIKNQAGLFIKVIETDSAAVAIRTFALHDGGYLTISRDKKHEHPGYAFKLSKEGNVLFKKRLSGLNLKIESVIEIPGNGFATVGYQDASQKYLIVCVYDYDANFVTSKQIQLPDFAGNYPVFRVLNLSNGNYAFASGNSVGLSTGILIFTDNAFNKIKEVNFSAPAGFYGYAINALCELPGNMVYISGSTFSNDPNQTLQTSYSNLFFQMVDFAGNKKSFTMVGDSVHSEAPNCLFNTNGNMFAVTSRCIGWNGSNGCFVDYEFSGGNGTISGIINLNLHDSVGRLINRKQVTGYPLNGMIQTAKPTFDGGYILCGTVNQANASTVVSETKFYLLKIDANRNVQWTKIFNTTYPSYGADVLQTSDGGYFVTGHENTFGKKFQTLLIKTDANGNYNN